MVATVPGGYINTINFAGTFNADSGGYVQGMVLDDPGLRFSIAGGIVASTETLPMYGGIGINEATGPFTGTNPPNAAQGGLLTRATVISSTGASGGLTGFTCFNQAYGLVITGNSPIPLAASYHSINFVRLGSNLRLIVAAAASLTSLEAGSVAQQVSWDFTGQQLIPYIAAYSAVAASGISSGTYTSSTGIISLTFGSAPFGAGVGSTANGAYITIAGLTGTGVSVLNGNWAITSTGTSGTVINLQGPTGLGSLSLTTTGATLAAGGGALPCKVIEIIPSVSMVVNYPGIIGGPSTSTNATWNYAGTVANILLSSFAA